MRFLLLFILFPFVVAGQGRRAAIVDSIKAAGGDLPAVSALVGRLPDAGVEHIGVTDSAGYVTLMVRVRLPEPFDAPRLSLRPPGEIRTGGISPLLLHMVKVPPQPPIIIRMDSFTAVPYKPVAMLGAAVPPASRLLALALPPPPEIVFEPEPVTLFPAAKLAVSIVLPGRMAAVIVPLLEIVPPDPVPLFPPTKQAVTIVLLNSMDTVVVPQLEILPPDPVPLFPMVELAVIPKLLPLPRDSVKVPIFEQKRMPVEEMHLSDEGYSLLEKLEGFAPDLYTLGDGGYTIGYGFFIPFSEGSKWRKGVTQEEADSLMRVKVPDYEYQVKKYINVPLTQAEFDALTMMAYNLGGFAKATSIVNDMNTYAGYEELKQDWMRFVHSKAPRVTKGLMRRRRDELKVRNELDYQPERKLQIFKSR